MHRIRWSYSFVMPETTGHEILSFLKDVSYIFAVSIFGGLFFSFGKKCNFMQKVTVFSQMSEFLSTVIISCCANFEVSDKCFY